MLAENTAKITYNASGLPAPFNEDCGGWIASALHDLVELLDVAGLPLEAWETISRPPTGAFQPKDVS